MEFPKRRPTRLRSYNYSAPGAYFVTICTHNRKHLLSHIIGANHDSPAYALTPYGEYAKYIIENIPQQFHINIDKYVIMPNHIHILLQIIDCDEIRAIRESPLRSVVSKYIGYLKMRVAKNIHKTFPETKVWQRSYHDHIIRNKYDYEKIWNYIDTNVLKWELDCFYDEK